MQITFQASNPIGNTIPNVQFKWKVVPGSATAQDLPLVSGALSVGRGSTGVVEIPLYRDLDNEPTEFFMIEIYQVVGGDAGVSSRSEQLKIVNLPAPTVSIPSITIKEGRTHHAFVSLSYAPDVVSNLRVYSTDSTAFAPEDYVRVETVLQFLPGSSSGLVPVKANADTDNDESLEEFYLRGSAFDTELGWGKIGIQQINLLREFSVPENSPVGTLVGSIDVIGYTDFFLSSPHFEVNGLGIITVKNNQFLDYEPVGLRVKREDVFAFEADGASDVYQVTVIVTDVNEKPTLVTEGSKFTIDALRGLPLTFTDPEGDSLSISATPGGVVKIGGLNPNTETLWYRTGVTTANAENATVNTTIVASDGTLSSDPSNLEINIKTGGTSRFAIGTTRPAYAEDEPGATGILADVVDPSAGWSTISPTLADKNLWFSLSNLSQTMGTEEARAAIKRFFDNTGADHQLNVYDILRKSNSVTNQWKNAIEEVISYVASTTFVGTVDLVEKKSHLGSTGDSVYSAAIGNYTGWSTARIKSEFVGGTFQYTVEYKYHMWDPYDWNPFKNETLPPILARLHLVGLAKQYMTEGSHGVTFSWQKGNPPVAPAP